MRQVPDNQLIEPGKGGRLSRLMRARRERTAIIASASKASAVLNPGITGDRASLMRALEAYRAVANTRAASLPSGESSAPSRLMPAALQARLNNRRGLGESKMDGAVRPSSSSFKIAGRGIELASLNARFESPNGGVKRPAGGLLGRHAAASTRYPRALPGDASGVTRSNDYQGRQLVGDLSEAQPQADASLGVTLRHGARMITSRGRALSRLLPVMGIHRVELEAAVKKPGLAQAEVAGFGADASRDAGSRANRTRAMTAWPAQQGHRGTNRVNNSGQALAELRRLTGNASRQAPRRSSSRPSLTINFNPSVEIKNLPDQARRQSIVDALAKHSHELVLVIEQELAKHRRVEFLG